MNLNFKAKLPHPYLLALGIFLVFAGVRIHLIMLHASQTPYWDDWGMGNRMALYMQSGFDPTWLYGLTNEHRAMFSKLTNLLLFKANNYQWDPYITMVLDAFMWAAIGLIVICIGFHERAKINPWLLAGLAVVVWTYPLSLFNTLSTIQTYLYFMILFVVCGFWLLTYESFSLKWSCGVLFIGAACMTAGGGSFAPVAVAAVSCFLAITNSRNRSKHVVTAAFASVFAVFGLYLLISQASTNPVGSKSLAPFLTTLFKVLSWPASDRVWPSVFFLLPIVMLALGIVSKKIPQSRLATFTLMMAAFGIMLAVAIAYARGATGSGPAERYFDFLSIYLVSSALSLMLIYASAVSKFARISVSGLAVLWTSMCILAVPYHLKVSKFQLNDRAHLVPVQEDIMARYSVTNDPTVFENRLFRQVPFPRTSTLRDFVERLNATDTMPYSLQFSSMQLEPTRGTFSKNGIAQPEKSRYRGLEDVLGSFSATSRPLAAMGNYTSEVFVAKRPYVMVPVSGHIGFSGTSLSLVGENNGVVVEVAPRSLSSDQDNRWSEVIVKAPDKEYRIVAKDESANLWFAFAAPRSVGRLSYVVDRIMSIGDKLWGLGLLLIVLAFKEQMVQLVSKPCKWLHRRTQPESGNSA